MSRRDVLCYIFFYIVCVDDKLNRGQMPRTLYYIFHERVIVYSCRAILLLSFTLSVTLGFYFCLKATAILFSDE